MNAIYQQSPAGTWREREQCAPPPSQPFAKRSPRPSSQQLPLPALHTLSLSELLTRPAPEYSWLVEPLLTRGGVMGLAGEPGTAKTWLILELAQAVATGRSFLQRFATRQGPVLIIDEENGETRLQRRLARLTGGTLGDCPVHIASMCGVNLSQEQWIDSLHGKLTEIRPHLTLLDSLVRMHRGEENSAQDISRLFAVLTSFRTEFGTAVVFTHHLRKMGFVRDMGQRVRGSSDILAYVDSMLGLSKIETAFTLSHIKNRDGDCIRPLSLSVEDTDDSTTAIRVIGEVDEEGSKREQARALILGALEDGDRFRDELTAIAGEAGIGARTFAVALKELEATRLIAGSFENRRKKYSTFALLQPIYSTVQTLQKSSPDGAREPADTNDNPTFALLQPVYNGVQTLQKSPPASDDPPGDTRQDPTFALLQTLQQVYPLQGLQKSPAAGDGSAPDPKPDPTFAELQPIYSTLQGLQKSHSGNGELTPDEKQALSRHWLDRGSPPVTLGRGEWLNLDVLLYSSDAYIAQKCREHAPQLRQLLACWSNNNPEAA